MAAAAKSNGEQKSWLISLLTWLKEFISIQREDFAARAASPPLTGINLVPEDYTPAKLVEHPGAGAHEDIEPMK